MPDSHRSFRAYDLFAFTFSATISIGVAFLPFVSGEEVRGAWLKLLLGSVPYFLLLGLIYGFTRKYPDRDFFGALSDRCWSGLYWTIMLYLILSQLFGITKFVHDLNSLLRTFLLFNTPKWAIVLSFLLVVALAVHYGIAAITRFVVLFAAVFALASISVCLIGLFNDFDWVFIPPVFTADWSTFMRSMISDMARYGGVVVLLGFILYMKDHEAVWKPMNAALGLVMFIYVLLSLAVVGTFGFVQAAHLVSPATALSQIYRTEAGLAERLDLFFLGLWIVSFYMLISIHFWFAVFLSRRCWPKVKAGAWIIVFAGLIFAANLMIPVSITQGWELLNNNHLFHTLILPAGLLIYLLLRSGRSKGARS